VAFSVEFCGVASPEFRGRGNEVVEVELASFLESMYETSADFLMGLVAGERTLDTNPGLLRVCCWDIYVDVLILGASGGNIVDATAFAIRAALATTLLPSVIWQENANGGSWELDERAENCQLLDATHAPLCSSVALLPTAMSGTRTRKDIPEFVAPELLVLDPCAEEETLAGCKISIAGTKNQHICALWKSGDLPVAPDVLLTATRLCQRECAIACLEMDQYLNDMIEAEPENDAD
jgi:exosome complex RNA-binding protein Rrp42 (RNase PH superfamily)